MAVQNLSRTSFNPSTSSATSLTGVSNPTGTQANGDFSFDGEEVDPNKSLSSVMNDITQDSITGDSSAMLAEAGGNVAAGPDIVTDQGDYVGPNLNYQAPATVGGDGFTRSAAQDVAKAQMRKAIDEAA